MDRRAWVGGFHRSTTKGQTQGQHPNPSAMAAPKRMSMYSTTSSGPNAHRNVISAAQQSSQVSTTTLLNAVHTIYTSGQPYKLDASSSVVVNTWLTAAQPDHEGRIGGSIDGELAARAWEHARRRAEDGCIFLGYAHSSKTLRCLLTNF